MKYLLIILFYIVLFSAVGNAQNADVIGKWKLFEMQKGEEVREVDSGIIFDEGGVLKMGFFDMQEILEVGTWDYDKKQHAIVMVSADEKMLNGKADILEVSKDYLHYKKDGIIYRLQKFEKAEDEPMLDFSEADFFTEDGDYKYEGEEEKLPRNDLTAMLVGLKDVKHLVYACSTYNEESKTYDEKQLTSDVESNPDEMSLSIDNIFIGFDRYNLPEDMELPPNNEYSNLLYPVEEFYFRVVSTEEITTAAGTFLCTVIEAAEAEIQKKLWMINDKPGIYAKVIVEKRGMFGAYSLQIFELNQIK